MKCIDDLIQREKEELEVFQELSQLLEQDIARLEKLKEILQNNKRSGLDEKY